MSSVEPALDIPDCWNRIGVWSRANPRCTGLEGVDHCLRCPVYAEAASRLRDRDLPEGYARAWRDHYAQPLPPRRRAQEVSAWLLFRLGAELFGLPVECVDEVIDPVAVHGLTREIPGAIKGLAAVHGRLRPCVDLAALLELDPAAGTVNPGQGGYPRMVVIRRQQSLFLFAVDEVLGVQRFGPDAIAPLPGTLARALKRLTQGLVQAGSQRAGLLDGGLLFDVLAGKAPA